jgi:hypothetical protein
MAKNILFSILTLILLSACGNESKIKGGPVAESLSEKYGDGKYFFYEPFLPLTEIDEVESLVSDLGLILSGFARTFLNIGVGLGLGKRTMSLIQPVPEIPRKYLKDIKLKRVFFYIEPHVKGERRFDWLTRFFRGKNDVDFNFLSKLAIMIRPHHIGHRESWMPIFNFDEKPDKQLEKKFMTYFQNKESFYPEYENPREARELLLLKYDKKKGDENFKNGHRGDIFIATTTQPNETRDYLLNHPEMKNFFQHIFILDKNLMIELRKDPVVSESFNVILSQERDYIDQLGVSFIEPCTKQTCLDLQVPDLSLIDIVAQDNAIKLDAFVEANEVPETFRLKGFIEFWTKVRDPLK